MIDFYSSTFIFHRFSPEEKNRLQISSNKKTSIHSFSF